MERGHTLSNVHSVSCESSALPHQRAFLGEKFRHFPTHELVADWLVTVWVDLVRVGHFPRSRSDTIIVADRFLDGCVFGLLGKECVSVWVLGAPRFTSALGGVDLEDSVIRSIDIGVDSQTEEMLVVMCIDSWVDLCSPTLGVLARVHRIGV